MSREDALALVEALWAAYDAGAEGYFDFFTADATVFPLSSGVRLEGREAYRRHSIRRFHGQPRATHFLRSEVRLLGESVLVTGHLRIRAEYQASDSRVTLLLVPEEGRFKVAHLHMSPLLTPRANDVEGLVEEVIGIAAPERERER